MPGKRYFGSEPPPATLEKLGLKIPDAAFRNAESLYEQAIRSRHEWTTLRDGLLQKVADLAQHMQAAWREAQAAELVRDIYRAGLRIWLDQVFGKDVPIHTPSDLNRWCSLQQSALAAVPDAYPVHLCWLDDRLLCDDALLVVAERLAHLSPEAVQTACEQLKQVYCLDPDDFYQRSDYHADVRSVLATGGEPPPEPPKPGEYQRLVRLAWEHARQLAEGAEIRPPEYPANAADLDICLAMLGRLAEWCRSLDESWHADQGGGDRVGETPRRREPVPREEANIKVRHYLREHPRATAREVAEAAGIATGRVPGLPAWQAHRAKKTGESRPKRRINERRLTDKILAVRGVENDPSEPMELEEAAWKTALDRATPEQRKALLDLTPKQQAMIIRQIIDEYGGISDTEE